MIEVAEPLTFDEEPEPVEERFEVGGDRCRTPLAEGGICGARMEIAGDGHALVCSLNPRQHACRVACGTPVADAVVGMVDREKIDSQFADRWAAYCFR